MDGASAFITGAGSGLGFEFAKHLLGLGCSVTATDVDLRSLKKGLDVGVVGRSLQCIHCDVTVPAQQEAAMARHIAAYGGLDYVVLNAGIGESGDMFRDADDAAWRRTYQVDLEAVLVGARLAVRAVTAASLPGCAILCVASAAGVFAVPSAPVYAAAKAGVYNFARSAASRVARSGCRITAFCPEFVDTPLLDKGGTPGNPRTAVKDRGEALIGVRHAVRVAVALMTDRSKNGVALVMRQDGSTHEWGSFGPKRPAAERPAPPADGAWLTALRSWAGGSCRHFRKLQVVRLDTDFSAATSTVRVPLPASVPPGHLLIRRTHAGINASDVNFTSGRYHGSQAAARAALPFDAGFEAVGVVTTAGSGCRSFSPGQPVASISGGGFAEYAVLPEAHCLAIPAPEPAAIALLTSGLTASIALEQAGRMRQGGQRVLVTAAAGGTGQFAVQLAAAAGNHVIATCSSEAKAALLSRLGAARVVNYRTESLKAVLKAEYPKGIDLVYESVGGEMFETAVNALARHGTLIVIGMMSQYGDGWPQAQHPGLMEKLLWKSATIAGFFLPHYVAHYQRHLRRLTDAFAAGELQVELDPTRFVGLDSVPAAVAHLQSGRSIGKVTVQLAEGLPPGATVSSRL